MGGPIPVFTPKLGFVLDGSGAVEVQPGNWARADETAGVFYTKSTDPPILNSVLYEGAIVQEKDTGKMYRCVSNGIGGWNKVWLNYPFFYVATANNLSPANTTDVEWGWNTYIGGANSSQAANMSPGYNGFLAPVKGQYSVNITVRWNGGSGQRRLMYKINHAFLVPGQSAYEQFIMSSGGYPCTNNLSEVFVLNAGDDVTMDVWQSSGAALGASSVIHASLIRPLP